MLTISVEFLHGSYRASDPDDLTITRRARPNGEWPPSPARLFAALVAADGTGVRQRVTDTVVDLEALEAAGPPAIYADGPSAVAQTVRLERFVVIDTRDASTAQNYPARRAQAIWPGTVTNMTNPTVQFQWLDLDLDDDAYEALCRRCARIGYLGCADSPVRVRADRAMPSDGRDAWWPDPAGSAVVAVPSPGLLGRLDDLFERFTTGQPVRRAWVAPALAGYRPPGTAATNGDKPQAETLWVRFDRPINGRRVVAVAETLKAAVLEHLSAALGGPDEVPSVIHGHCDGEVARWLPLPMVGTRHADGRIRGACVWLPSGTPPWIVAETANALSRIDRLVRPDVFDVAVSMFDGTDQPLTSNPRTWTRPARRFITAFPAVHERRVKGALSLDDVTGWCRHAGLPDPVAFRASPVPLLEGAASLMPSEVFRRRDQHRPYCHLEVVFADPVTGPAAIGRGRQYGLGLLVPVRPQR